MDSTQILTRDEISAVLQDLHRRAYRSYNSLQNLIIFRLSCCCGLRCMEICGLDVSDVITAGARPCIRIRKDNTKGRDGKRRVRIVPLWWDAWTLEDLDIWKQKRIEEWGSGTTIPFISGLHGLRLTESSVARRWRTAIKSLGPERLKQISIHSGRHSFVSHALMIGRSLAEVRDAAGHANVSTTSIYLHVLERTGIADMFPKTT
jgi:integrase/recombinase XerD